MNQELVLTSAPQGLKKGSKGFCTVISTAGMAASLAERLESMSGYRHPFKPPDPKAERNPVNYAHVTTRLAGEKLHILSRVSDPGVDYSGRTNKLAHHLVVDDPSALPAGPARIFSDTNHFLTKWDGTVGTQEPPAISSPATPHSIKLSAWAQVTGDGGWAGFVAEHLLAGQTPINVIFPFGTNTLDLVREVLDLIPIPKRWTITFSTYFIKLLASTECQLRFVLDGTPEATHLRNNARAVVVDLTTALGQASGGTLVEQARSGKVTRAPQKAPKPPASTRRRETAPSVSNEELEGFLDSDWDEDDLESTSRQAGRGRRMAPAPGPRPRSDLDDLFSDSTPVQQKWIVPAAVVAICLAGVIGIFFAVRKRPDVPAVAQRDPAPALETPVEPASEPDAETAVAPQSPEEESPPPPSPVEPAEAEPEVPDPPVLPFDGKKPFHDLKNKLLTAKDTLTWSLPSPREGKAPDSSDSFSIFVSSPADIKVELIPKEPFSIELSTDDGTVRWNVKHGEDTHVGYVLLTSPASNEPVKMRWNWAEGVFNQKDPTSPEATAARRFRHTTLKLSASAAGNTTSETEVANLKIDKGNWSPFEYVPGWPQGSTVNNLTSVLDVPEYDLDFGNPSDAANARSRPIYLILDDPSQLSIKPLPNFDLIEPDYVVVIDKVETDNEPGIRPLKFSVSIRGKDDPHGDNDVVVADYVVESHDDSGLHAIDFKWRHTNEELRRKAWWCPIIVNVGSQQTLLFPRGPIKRPFVDMTDLAQNDRIRFDLDLPELEDDSLSSTEITYRIGKHKKSKPISTSVDDTDDKPADKDDDKPAAFWFELKPSLSIVADEPKPTKDSLGSCSLTFNYSYKDREANGRIQAHLNRRDSFMKPEISPVDPLGKDFWRKDGGFKVKTYLQHGKEWTKSTDLLSNVSDDEQRIKFQSLRRYKEIETKLTETESRIQSRIKLWRSFLGDSKTELLKYPSINDDNVGRLIKAREIQKVKAEIDRQLAILDSLSKTYSIDQWTVDKKIIEHALEELDGKSLDYDVATNLSWGDKTIRLYLVKTVAEGAEDEK